AGCGGLALAVAIATAVVGPRVRYGEPVPAPEWVAGIREGRLDSAYCISCHKEAGTAWNGSLHHLANQEISAARPGASFLGQTASTHAAGYTFAHGGAEQGPIIREERRDGTVIDHRPSMMIAYGTLRQFLVPDTTGRFQATEVAWDPHKLEWFGVFGMEERNPGEWGHWTGQSMNWNSMCARCHMTAYHKGYDEATDRYQSTWGEQGIGCLQCHGPMTGHESGGKAMQRVDNISRQPARMMETCAACHARAEDLTASMPPGAAFEDHFRLQLMADPTYYADGQIRDEDFEWGSFRHSRMHTAGATCLDCHNAHTGKLKLPLEGNALCMQCHAEGNERKAPVINPTAHSFHKPESTGNRCVECHMRETTYMQRDPRRDHGFITPDPLLNKELGIPDSCTKCHADKSVDWNIEAWEKWYGPSGKAAPRRARTRAVARAYAGDATVVPELLRLIDEERVPAWRASLLELARGLDPDGAAVAPMAMRLRSDPDNLIRAAAVRALGQTGAGARFRPQLQAALKDPSRLVRLDAAWPLSPELAAGSPERRELDAYLDVFIDSPVSLMRRGQDRFRRGRAAEAIADLQRAIRLDPLSAPLPETLGFILDDSDRPAEAAAQFERAAELAPASAGPPYFAALAWAAAGDLAKAEKHLRSAVGRDPSHGRAWYNLGLLLNQTGRPAEALDALAHGEKQGAADPDIPYAAATILLQAGRRDEAVAAARRALAIDPHHQPSTALLRQLQSGAGP
ncbi:MAG: tetratricopeptide repeat protein, partial [Opitutaceae bacterium]|nr:tetratricopeptide repeat protein [Opitutaceae bacterium]